MIILQLSQHVGGDKYSRSGPATILVTRESATSGRCFNDKPCTIQIDENHSDMVKFPSGEHKIHVITSRLAEICDMLQSPSSSQREANMAGHGDISEDKDSPENRFVVPPNNQSSTVDNLWWDDERKYFLQ